MVVSNLKGGDGPHLNRRPFFGHTLLDDLGYLSREAQPVSTTQNRNNEFAMTGNYLERQLVAGLPFAADDKRLIRLWDMPKKPARRPPSTTQGCARNGDRRWNRQQRLTLPLPL